MKLAMAQMSMTGSMDENLKRSLAFCDAAAGSAPSGCGPILSSRFHPRPAAPAR